MSTPITDQFAVERDTLQWTLFYKRQSYDRKNKRPTTVTRRAYYADPTAMLRRMIEEQRRAKVPLREILETVRQTVEVIEEKHCATDREG